MMEKILRHHLLFCPVKWRKHDGPHYSQWGPSGAVGVRHVTDPTIAVIFWFLVPRMEQKTVNNADVNRDRILQDGADGHTNKEKHSDRGVFYIKLLKTTFPRMHQWWYFLKTAVIQDLYNINQRIAAHNITWISSCNVVGAKKTSWEKECKKHSWPLKTKREKWAI